MSRLESGVAGYITGTVTIKVHFPVDKRGVAEISCKHCPYYNRYDKACRLNNKPIAYPEHYVGDWCPLEIEEEKE